MRKRKVKTGWQRAGSIEHNLDTGAWRCAACKGPIRIELESGKKGQEYKAYCDNPGCPEKVDIKDPAAVLRFFEHYINYFDVGRKGEGKQ